MTLQKEGSESELHFLMKKKIGEALIELGFAVEFEKRVKEGEIDVYGVKDGNEIKVEVMKSHAPGWFLAKVKGELYKKSKYEEEYTQIRIRKSTLELIKKVAKYGESYNDVIDRVIGKISNDIPYGRLGNRPINCEDPDNPKHVCYKDCL